MLRRSGHGESAGSRLHHVQHVAYGVQSICRTSAPGSSFGYMFGDLQKDPANRLPPTPATVLALKQVAKTMTDIPEQLPGNGDDGPGDIPAEPETAGRVRPDETASQIALAIQPDVIALSVFWWMTMGRGCVERRG